jgi:plasmid stability protein
MADGLTLQVDDETARRLKVRAERDGLSVEEEARRLLDRALRDWEQFWAKADEIRKGLAGRKFQDSTELIREDRER